MTATFAAPGHAFRLRGIVAALAGAMLVAACGGGSGSGESAAETTAPVLQPQAAPTMRALAAATAAPVSRADAARLLTQATFGPRRADIDRVVSIGAKEWVGEQTTMPYDPKRSHLAALRARPALGQEAVLNSLWQQAATAPDQLRQRMAFALSQIFVVSYQGGEISAQPELGASYYDMLTANAFGDYRKLLEAVARHPAMGNYLSHLKNEKEDPVSGRIPDENFAREILQLFSIGLQQLQPDGTPLTTAGGQPIDTYTSADVQGLAKVFTGWSWAGPDKSVDRFFGNPNALAPERFSTPMQAYPAFHSTSEKRFLGVTVPAQQTADPGRSMALALDAIAGHPNVAPFISRQLIQRLVTSNPSPAYVGRVAAVFANNGSGVRGDLAAVARAVLLDEEARSPEAQARTGYGKVKEPMLRATAWMRAFNAKSSSGGFTMGYTDSAATSLNQSPLRSPSVFNFYRPGHVAPGSAMAASGLGAPEQQLSTDSSLAGYVNTMLTIVSAGAGINDPARGRPDVQATYTDELALAGDVDRLLDHLNGLLMAGRLSDAQRQATRSAMLSIPMGTTAAAQKTTLEYRVQLAVFMLLVAPEFIVQK